MEPRVQYAKTSDDVSIACTVLGAGADTIVNVPNIWGDLQLYKMVPVARRWYDATVGRGYRVVIYDSRNMGSSEHRDLDYSTAARLADLEAVIERVGGERFCLYGMLHGCMTAVEYTVAHPELVDRLVLVNPFARGRDYYTSIPEMAMTSRLSAGTPEEEKIFHKSLASIVTGFADQSLAEQFTEMMGSSMSAEEVGAFGEATRDTDMTDLLARLTLPTLVLFWPRLLSAVLPLTREVARLIPNAEFAEVGGQGLAADLDVGFLDLVDGFLRGEREQDQAADAAAQPPSAFRTVLFTDIVGHTEMMRRLGDARGRALLREHETITRGLLKEHGGTEVKTMGDGFMASFGSVAKAVECAIALQRAFAERNESADETLQVRVGLNAGEPIEEEGDLFGATVILAARIAAKADAGEILVADTVRGLCSGKGFLFADRGEFAAKGFEEPVRVFEVRWQD